MQGAVPMLILALATGALAVWPQAGRADAPSRGRDAGRPGAPAVPGGPGHRGPAPGGEVAHRPAPGAADGHRHGRHRNPWRGGSGSSRAAFSLTLLPLGFYGPGLVAWPYDGFGVEAGAFPAASWPPEAFVAPPPVWTRPEPVIVPRRGQGPGQTERDRQACNRWATTLPAAMADAAEFERAAAACMESRDYTVHSGAADEPVPPGRGLEGVRP
jgi:hypothetical protein